MSLQAKQMSLPRRKGTRFNGSATT